MKLDITIGSRVRMSALGAERCPRLAEKIGTVVGGSIYNNSVSIRFDGKKSAVTLHRNYIEGIATYDPASIATTQEAEADPSKRS
jgi:hypothetical protein